MAEAAVWLSAAALCGAAFEARADELMAFPRGEAQPPAPWHFAGLPQQTKPQTQFGITELDGRRVLKVEAIGSYGNLVHPLPAGTAAGHMRWSWRVDEFSPHTDLHSRSGDDTAIKVCASFDLPMDRVPFVERQLLRLANLHASEPLPAATLCYVWDEQLADGTLLDNAFTRRIRLIVLRNAADGVGHWHAERRDLTEDFHRAFGDESTDMPPLLGVAIGADADNTQGHSIAYVSGLALEP